MTTIVIENFSQTDQLTFGPYDSRAAADAALADILRALREDGDPLAFAEVRFESEDFLAQ